MAYDDEVVDRVRGALAGRGLDEKRMFGSLAFSSGGHIVCGVREQSLFVRVGKDDYERALAEPHVDTFPPTDTGNRAMSGFVTVEPDGFASDSDLASWVETGIQFVATLPPK